MSRAIRALRHPFTLCYLATLLVMPGPVDMVSDSPQRLDVAHWLWTGQPLTHGIKGPDGRLHAHFGVGHSLVLLPADVAATELLRHVRLNVPDARFKVASYLFFPFLNGLALWAAHGLLRGLAFSNRQCLAGTLGLLFGSSFLWHCQNNQENPLQLLLVLLGLICFVRYAVGRDPRWLLAGAAPLAFNLLTRLTAVTDLLAVSLVPVLFFFFQKEKGAGAFAKTYLRYYALWAVPLILVGLGVDRAYHYHRFGTLTGTYIDRWGEELRESAPFLPASFPFPTPFWEGFVGTFFYPATSPFIYDPLFVFATVCAVGTWGRLAPAVKAVVACAALSLVVTAAGYAKFWVWSSDPAWGDRYISIPVHVLVLLSIPLCMRYAPNWLVGARKALVAGLVSVAVGIQAFSLVMPAWVESLQAGDTANYIRKGVDPPGLGVGKHFQLGMRVRNVAAVATGRWEAWGLDQAADGKVIGPHPIILVPFLPLETLSLAARALVKGCWFAALGLLLAGLFSCWRVLTPTTAATSRPTARGTGREIDRSRR